MAQRFCSNQGNTQASPANSADKPRLFNLADFQLINGHLGK
jgi:hypothetical protein